MTDRTALAKLDQHHDGRLRIVYPGQIVDADAGWNCVRQLFTAEDVQAASEEYHQRMGISMWTIYENPTDHPGDFVARRWHGSSIRMEPTTDVFTGATLDGVRQQLPQGLYNIGRKHGDEPQIVEVWV
jgi:hypothetical protein